MYAKSVLALAGAFLSLAAAVPMNKRDLVWVTMTDEEVVTVAMTKTVWLNQGDATPVASSSHYGHNHKPKVTSTIHSTVYVQPVSSSESSAAPSAPATEEAPTSSESVYVAPPASSTASTTSEYVAPTSQYVAPITSSTSSSTTSVYVAPASSSTSVYVAPVPSSTSVYIAPVPTSSSTSVYVAPAPTSTWVAPTTTSAAAQPTETSSSGGSDSPMSGKSYSGDLTYYDPGLGACGITSGSDEHIVAVSEVTFDLFTPNGNPNNNPLCGQKVSITGSSGSTYEATIVDRCVGCKAADLDLSPGFFTIVEPDGNGRVHNVDWKFL